MASAPTLTEQRRQAEEAGARAERELAELHAERRRISLDVLAGKPAAVKRAGEIAARIGELAAEQHLAGLAVAEADRRTSEAEAKAQLDQRAADEAALNTALRRRDEHYRCIQGLTAQLAGEVAEALRLGGEIHDARVRLGHPYAPDRTGGAIHDYLSARLGPLAGLLRDLPTPLPPHRGPLVADTEGGTDR